MIKSDLDLDLEEFAAIEWTDDETTWLEPSDDRRAGDAKKDAVPSRQLFGEISLFGDEQWTPDDDVLLLVDHDYENERRLVGSLDRLRPGHGDVFGGSGRSDAGDAYPSRDFYEAAEDGSSAFSRDFHVFENVDISNSSLDGVPTIDCYPHPEPVRYHHRDWTSPRGHLSSTSSDEGFSEPLPPICSLLPSALQTPSPTQERPVEQERLSNCKQYLRQLITGRRVHEPASSSHQKVPFSKVEVKEEEVDPSELYEEDSDLGESFDEDHDDAYKKNNEELLECRWEACWKIFCSQSELVRHIESSHLDSPRPDLYPCYWLDCPRRSRPFNARYKLLIHMRVHSGEKPNKCPFAGCKKAFSRLENLKIHQRSHTGERPYLCQFSHCRKAFSNSSDRAKHLRTHFDTKPYACQVEGCSKKYTDPSSLRKHIKNHGGLHYSKPKKLTASKPVVSAAEVNARRLMPIKNEAVEKMRSNEDGDKSPSKSVSNFIGYDDIDEDFIEIIIADRQWLNNDSNQDNLSTVMDSDTENELLDWTNMECQDLLLLDAAHDILDV